MKRLASVVLMEQRECFVHVRFLRRLHHSLKKQEVTFRIKAVRRRLSECNKHGADPY